jgi:RHS repeat-associated protein
MRFPGQYADKETNRYYNYSRDYDPASARYLESDLIGLLGGLNTYAYVEADPLAFADPFGLQKDPTKLNPIANVPMGFGGGGGFGGGPTSSARTGSGISGACDPCKRGAAGPARLVPNFVVNSQGQVIPIPGGAYGPFLNANPTGNITGWGYTGGMGWGTRGLSSNVISVRIMNPTPPRGPSPGYPGGYVNYLNPYSQSVNPYSGSMLSKDSPWWHIPLMCTPDG